MPNRYNVIVTRTVYETSVYAVEANDKEEAELKFDRMDDYARAHCLVDYQEDDEITYGIKAV